MREKLLCGCAVWPFGFLQSVNQANQLLGRMGERNIVVLALSPLLGKISSKGWVPKADIFGGVVKRVAQITGASPFHVRIGSRQRKLPGLVSRWRYSGIRKDLIRRVEAGEVTDLGKDHSAHADTHAGDSSNGRLYFVHHGLDSSLNVLDLGVQLVNQADRMPQFQGLGRHDRADRAPGSIPLEPAFPAPETGL